MADTIKLTDETEKKVDYENGVFWGYTFKRKLNLPLDDSSVYEDYAALTNISTGNTHPYEGLLIYLMKDYTDETNTKYSKGFYVAKIDSVKEQDSDGRYLYNYKYELLNASGVYDPSSDIENGVGVNHENLTDYTVDKFRNKKWTFSDMFDLVLFPPKNPYVYMPPSIIVPDINAFVGDVNPLITDTTTPDYIEATNTNELYDFEDSGNETFTTLVEIYDPNNSSSNSYKTLYYIPSTYLFTIGSSVSTVSYNDDDEFVYTISINGMTHNIAISNNDIYIDSTKLDKGIYTIGTSSEWIKVLQVPALMENVSHTMYLIIDGEVNIPNESGSTTITYEMNYKVYDYSPKPASCKATYSEYPKTITINNGTIIGQDANKTEYNIYINPNKLHIESTQQIFPTTFELSLSAEATCTFYTKADSTITLLDNKGNAVTSIETDGYSTDENGHLLEWEGSNTFNVNVYTPCWYDIHAWTPNEFDDHKAYIRSNQPFVKESTSYGAINQTNFICPKSWENHLKFYIKGISGEFEIEKNDWEKKAFTIGDTPFKYKGVEYDIYTRTVDKINTQAGTFKIVLDQI